MTGIHIAILLLLIGLIVGIAIFLFYRSQSSSSPGPGTTSLDDSDVPRPPSTLEYNATYVAPKRNDNIMSASGSKVLSDKKNGTYTLIPEDSQYTL